MIQLIVLGFFVCLGAMAAKDIYEWGLKFITHEGVDAIKKGASAAKEGAHKLHEKVDNGLGIHKDEHKEKVKAT